MSSSIEAELLGPNISLEYDLHDSDFAEEEENEEEDEENPPISSQKDGDMIENYDRRELISNEQKLEVKSLLEPYLGMEFESEEAVREFYYGYAKAAGFTVRISKCRRARDGGIVCRRFVCSKEGFYVRKFGRTKRSRALTRVGCLARLVIKRLESGSWVVAGFEREHNHPPFVPGAVLNYEPPQPVPGVKPDGVSWRFGRLREEGIRLAEEGSSSSSEVFDVALAAIKEAAFKVMAAKTASASFGEVCLQGMRVEDSGGPRQRVQGDGDANAAQEQEWDAVAGSSSASLSEAQEAALQAVAEAFNVPALGENSSAVQMKGMTVTGEGESGRRSGDFHEPLRTQGPNPLVHAAAIAAGARIASPEVAASLIRAVQSRSAVHIRTVPFPKQTPQPSQQHMNSQYELASGELAPNEEINARAMAEIESAATAAAVAAHSSLLQHHHPVAEQQHAGSAVV